jgi:adenosylhomocysteine nucleosidase
MHMIAIIAAMDKELNTLLDALAVSEVATIAGKTFYVGTLCGREAVIAKSGIGKVNAAVTTALLLDHYEVDHLINTGLAGGISPSKCGDIVVSSGVAYSDVDFGMINPELPFGQMEGEPFIATPDADMLKTAENILIDSKTGYRIGTIVSGDRFVTGIQELEPILKNIHNVIACEMEGMAVALTCYHFKVPFIIMRGISDVIDAPGQVHDYREISTRIAARTTGFILRFVGEFPWKK